MLDRPLTYYCLHQLNMYPEQGDKSWYLKEPICLVHQLGREHAFSFMANLMGMATAHILLQDGSLLVELFVETIRRELRFLATWEYFQTHG